MLMKKTMYVHDAVGKFDLWNTDMSGECNGAFGVCIGTVEMSGEFTPPTQAEIVAAQVSALRDQIAATQADAQVKVNALQLKIDKLTALTMEVPA